jgi:plasmid stabilization system protein ParE
LRQFLSEKDDAAAQRALQAIARAIQSLIVLPERGRKAPVKGFRELVVRFGRSSYIVKYTYRPRLKAIFVVRAWHGREQRD